MLVGVEVDTAQGPSQAWRSMDRRPAVGTYS
jgi:hypothetical protein